MQGITHTTKRLIETSLSGGVILTAGSRVANLLYTLESILSNNAYSTQCRVHWIYN